MRYLIVSIPDPCCLSYFNGIHLSEQNCLTRYRLSPSLGRTGLNGQNIRGHRDLLINEENAF